MKKNRMMRLASILLVCVLLTTSVISGTFAKYTSEATVEDTAIVANWAFTVNEQDITDATTITFDLFGTVSDDTTLSGDDENVANGSTPIIAPGTGGSFSMRLKNTSEVAAKYALDYTVDEAGVPLQWSTDGTTWTADLDDVAASAETTLAVGAAEKTVTVYWKWAFEANDVETAQSDTSDTALGNAATKAQPKVTVKITATQVD